MAFAGLHSGSVLPVVAGVALLAVGSSLLQQLLNPLPAGAALARSSGLSLRRKCGAGSRTIWRSNVDCANFAKPQIILDEVPMKNRLGIALIGLALSLGALGQSSSTLRATELRADKLADAPVLAALVAGSEVRLLGMEGGWVQVQALGRIGWVRAGALNLKTEDAAVARLASGRLASGNNALTLGVRSLAPRINRHALIIGISRYEDPETPPLPGAHIDRQSATQMAQAMQVPMENIYYLQDEKATGDNIRTALA